MHGIVHRKVRRQPGAENHHTLGVNVATQLYVPLDIDHGTITIVAGCRYPVRQAELETAGRQHRQRIHLPHAGAGGGDQRGAVADGIVELVTNATAAVTGTFQRPLHVHLGNQPGTGLAGPEIRFTQQIGNIRGMQR